MSKKRAPPKRRKNRNQRRNLRSRNSLAITLLRRACKRAMWWTCFSFQVMSILSTKNLIKISLSITLRNFKKTMISSLNLKLLNSTKWKDLILFKSYTRTKRKWIGIWVWMNNNSLTLSSYLSKNTKCTYLRTYQKRAELSSYSQPQTKFLPKSLSSCKRGTATVLKIITTKRERWKNGTGWSRFLLCPLETQLKFRKTKRRKTIRKPKWTSLSQ